MQRYLLIVLLFVPFAIKGQYSFYVPAIVLKTDSVKLNGYVEKVSESELNPAIKFKQRIDINTFEKLPVETINEVIFLPDSEIFQKVKYEYYKDSVKYTEYRLAKKLISGYANLYKLELHENELKIIYEKTNTFVYIVQIDTNYYTLSLEEKIVYFKRPYEDWGQNLYKLDKKYQGVLTVILYNYPDLSGRARNTEFNDKQIVKLISELNKRNPQVANRVLFSKEKLYLNHGPTLGALKLNSLDNTGNGFMFGYTISLTEPHLSRRFSTNLSLFYEEIFYTDKNDINTYRFDYIKLPIGATWRFNNNRISPFIGGSVGLMHYNYESIPVNEFYFNGSFGFTFFHKVQASLSIESKTFNRKTPKIYYLNLGYRFGDITL